MLIDRSSRIAALRAAFEDVKKFADGVNVECYCPKCRTGGKRKQKLSVRLDDGKFHCWVCGIKGTSITNVVRRYRPDLLERFVSLWPQRTRGRTIDVAPIVHDEVQLLPPQTKMIAAAIEAGHNDRNLNAILRYLRMRNVSDADMWRYRLCYSDDPDYAGYVIIPSFDDAGHLNYHIARTIEKRGQRYKNALGHKQAIVFNEIDVDWSQELTLVEGPFDVMKTVGNVTCLLGSSIDKSFLLFHKIVENQTPIVLALDSKERRKTTRIARMFHSYDVPVRIMSVDGYKDVGEMTKDVYRERLLEARQWTPKSNLIDKIASIDVHRSMPISGSYF